MKKRWGLLLLNILIYGKLEEVSPINIEEILFNCPEKSMSEKRQQLRKSTKYFAIVTSLWEKDRKAYEIEEEKKDEENKKPEALNEESEKTLTNS